MIFWLSGLFALFLLSLSDYKTLHLPFNLLVFFHLISFSKAWFEDGLSFWEIVMICGISFLFWILFKKSMDFLFKKESIGGGDILLFPAFSFWFSGMQYALFLAFISLFLFFTRCLLRQKQIPMLPAISLSFFLFCVDHLFALPFLTSFL